MRRREAKLIIAVVLIAAIVVAAVMIAGGYLNHLWDMLR